MQSLAGHLLIASPYLRDANFRRAVVLVLRHDDRGAMGVVLNRPVDERLNALCRRVIQRLGLAADCRVGLGGPVEGPLVALHDPDPPQWALIPGVAVASDARRLRKPAEKNLGRFRIFFGHAGWTSGQLEREIEQGAWYTMPARREHVFGDEADDLWVAAVRQVGRSLIQSMLRIPHIPQDPLVN